MNEMRRMKTRSPEEARSTLLGAVIKRDGRR